MADMSTLDSSKVIPKDLEISTQPDTDKNFTRITITNLKLNKTYALQVQYVLKDGTLSDWSPTYLIITNNELTPDAPTGITVPSTSQGYIPVELTAFPDNAKRVDVYVIGGSYGTGKVAGTFLKTGKILIPADAGTYTVQLITVTPANVTSSSSQTFTITVSGIAGETVQNPTNPNGFSAKRILAGVELSWAGTYANGTFTGFEAINIYAGNSATATPGTYEQVGVLTGNNVKNTIVIPVGTYVVYGQPVYIHAAAVNKNGTVGTIQSNVASVALGPGKATDADINDGAVIISKLASDVLTVGNLKAGDINSTSYIRAGTAGSARVEISSSTVGSVLPGLTVYASDGTTQLLRAPLTGGLTITGSGTFTGDLYTSNGDFSVVSGSITANAGTIGKWVINSGRFASSSVTYPKIELDPSPTGTNPQIVLRSNAGATESGNVVKLNTTDGIRVGTYNAPNFTVAMDGTLTANSATITGKIISSGTNPAGGTGTLTIDSGWITHSSYMYLQAGSFFAISTPSSFLVDAGSGLFSAMQFQIGDNLVGLGSGTGSGDVYLRMVPSGGTNPGIDLYGLDFRQDSTANNGTVGRTVTHLAGGLAVGRAFYQGAASSAATIDSVVSAQVGDIYFSTT